jgi:hypothetical protein
MGERAAAAESEMQRARREAAATAAAGAARGASELAEQAAAMSAAHEASMREACIAHERAMAGASDATSVWRGP